MKNHSDREPDDEITPEDEANLRREVEKLLSKSQENAPQAYVLETMSVYSHRISSGSRSRREKIHFEYKASMKPVLALISRIALKVYYGEAEVDGKVTKTSIAILAEPGKMENLGLPGETMWMRMIDCDELFETSDQTLLLQPRDIRIIHSDFVQQALQKYLHSDGYDARMAVLHAAWECLMEELDDDLALIPDRFSEVVQAVDEVLSDVDWFSITGEDIVNLTADVVRRVP